MSPRAAILIALLFVAACGDAVHHEVVTPTSMRLAAPAGAAMDAAKAEGGTVQAAPDAATPRYLAERQFWVFELPEKDIEARWQAHIALCRQDCEVLHAALGKSAHSPVSAALQLRVGRASADKLLGAMNGPEVSERRVEREDKTLQVVDVEARLKTLGDLRDRLRELLAKRAGSLKDILETERELARVRPSPTKPKRSCCTWITVPNPASARPAPCSPCWRPGAAPAGPSPPAWRRRCCSSSRPCPGWSSSCQCCGASGKGCAGSPIGAAPGAPQVNPSDLRQAPPRRHSARRASSTPSARAIVAPGRSGPVAREEPVP